MSDICKPGDAVSQVQQARDALAKCRATKVELRLDFHAPLIAGTAGNPDLLDAIDLMLHCAVGIQRQNAELVEHAHFIAAAIIAADQRMSA